VSIPPPAAFDGSSSTLRASKLAEICELVCTISSVFPVTVTVSVGDPTSSATLISVVSATLTSTPVVTLLLKPEVGAIVTEYLPGNRLVMTKAPSSLVVVVDASIPVASFLAVTVAPATTPPFGSTTDPLNVPEVAWAITGSLKRKIIVTSESVNAAKSANDFAMDELFIFCCLLV
jgi:hypothetical protein